MCNTQRWSYVERHADNLPNDSSKRTMNKEVLYSLIMITETTLFASLPISSY
jgi:hypothetical protein